MERLIERMKRQGEVKDDNLQKDYLDYFIEKIGSEPWINDNQVVNWLLINVSRLLY